MTKEVQIIMKLLKIYNKTFVNVTILVTVPIMCQPLKEILKIPQS